MHEINFNKKPNHLKGMKERKVVVKESEFLKGAPMETLPGIRDIKVIYPELIPDVRSLCMGIVEVDPGHHTPLHKHNCEEVYYILSGRGYVEVDGIKYEVKAGDAVYIKENLPHRIFNTGEEILRYVDVAGIMFVSLLPEWPTQSPYVILEKPKQ